VSSDQSEDAKVRGGWWTLAGFFGACFLVAGLGGLATATSVDTWYVGLAKPSFAPPDRLFGPVWTVLYAMIAVSGWLAWRAPSSVARTVGLRWYFLQLALNLLWSVIFFGLHATGAALIDIAALLLAIVVTMAYFWRVDRAAALLLVPYVAWVAFAAALNLSFYRLN
jgi:tryptophan-rich sensory protein